MASQRSQARPVRSMVSSRALTWRSSVRFMRPPWPHHRRPTSATKPAGQDLWARLAPTIGASTAPFSPESQSFLDNVIAQFADVRAWNDRLEHQTSNLGGGGSNPSERANKIKD